MKILHLSDLHFNREIFRWITDHQDTADVICLTGDFLDSSIGAELSLNEQALWIQSWLLTLSRPVLMCSGNHDPIEPDLSQVSLEDLFNLDEDFEDPRPPEDPFAWLHKCSSNTVFVDGRTIEIGGLRFGCVPYMVEDYTRYLDCDVLLHHVPPSNTQIAIGSDGDHGCKDFYAALRSEILKPAYVLSGHIHDPRLQTDVLLNTALFNPGYGFQDNSPRFNLIDTSTA